MANSVDRILVVEPDEHWRVAKEIDKFGYDIDVIHGPNGMEVRNETIRSEGAVTPMNFLARSDLHPEQQRISIVLTSAGGMPQKFLPEGVIYLRANSQEEVAQFLLAFACIYAPFQVACGTLIPL